MEAWAGVLNDFAGQGMEGMEGMDPNSFGQGMGMDGQGMGMDMNQFGMAGGDFKRDNEGQFGEEPEAKKAKVVIPCRFFMRGACTNGDGCRFSHDPAHMMAAQGQAMGMVPDDIVPDPNAKGYKITLCRFFLSGGRCTRGELCTFAHGVEELRRSMNEKNLSIMVESQSNNEMHYARQQAKADQRSVSNVPAGLRAGLDAAQFSKPLAIQNIKNTKPVTQDDVMQALATLGAAGFSVNAPDFTGVVLEGADVEVKIPASTDGMLKVYIDKSGGDRLGIKIDQSPEGGILVTACEETGLVAVWNQYRPDERVSPGDKIVSVNGTSGSPQTMLAEIKKNQILLLTVAKAGFQG